MFHLLLRAILILVILWFSIRFLEGIALAVPRADFAEAFIITSALILLGEGLAYPLFNAFIFPLRVLTLGIASVFVSVLILYFVSSFYEPFQIGSFLNALFLAIMFAIARFGTDDQ